MTVKYLMTEAELLMLLQNAYETGTLNTYCAEPDEEWYKAHEYCEKTCDGCVIPSRDYGHAPSPCNFCARNNEERYDLYDQGRSA